MQGRQTLLKFRAVAPHFSEIAVLTPPTFQKITHFAPVILRGLKPVCSSFLKKYRSII